MKRTRLKPVSDSRRVVNALRKEAQEKAWGPRPWTCVFTDAVRLFNALAVDRNEPMMLLTSSDRRCFGEVNGHEILSRAQSTKDENLIDVSGQVTLCNFHNGWCDLNQELAVRLGLVRKLEVGE
jgi:hypothetical protein